MTTAIPNGLTLGECARCGKPVLVPAKDPKNHEMECCPRCTHDVCKSVYTPAGVIDREAIVAALGRHSAVMRYADSDYPVAAVPMASIIEALNLLPGRTVSQVKAEALREAAVDVSRIDPQWDSALYIDGLYEPIPDWLNARADELEREGGR